MKRCKMDLNLQCLLQKNFKGRKKQKKRKEKWKKARWFRYIEHGEKIRT